MNSFFRSLKVINKSKGSINAEYMHFINGWLVSISGLRMLWDVSNVTENRNYVLYTSRLNFNCLKQVFDSIHQQQGNSFNPTPIKVSRAFQKVFLNYFKQFKQLPMFETDHWKKGSIIDSPVKNQYCLNVIENNFIDTVDYRF